MPLSPGDRIGPYSIGASLGAGGMGEVYRATDEKLRREVAIKTLPEDLAESPERLQRFEREAQLLASLNHPHIAAIYGMEQSRYLVLELVEGETLEEKIARGPLPVTEALTLGLQIADGLEAAHEKGIIHRDLKPANVKVTPEGNAKILDFGLGKAMEEEASSAGPSMSPTMTTPATLDGAILGTAAYMSPEQAKGKRVDRRADIWSFGVVLFELLQGRRLFLRETISETLAAVLTVDPDLDALPAGVPPRVRTLLRRCFERNPRGRLRDIGDARLELQDALAGKPEPASEAAPASRRSPWVTVVLAAAMLGLGFLAASFLPDGDEGRSGDARRLSIVIPPELEPDDPVLSPDDSTIAFVARRRDEPGSERSLYLRSLDTFEVREVPESAGVALFEFTPSGRWISWAAPTRPGSARYRVMRMPVDGSAPAAAVMDIPDDAYEMLWIDDDEMLWDLVTYPKQLVRYRVDGGTPSEPVTVNFEGNLRPRVLLGDGRHALATVWAYSTEFARVDAYVLDFVDGEMRLLLENADEPDWLPSGHLVFSRDDTLYAAPFDLDRHELTGSPEPLLDGLWRDSFWEGGYFRVSPSGAMLYIAGVAEPTGRRLILIDGEGNVTPWTEEKQDYQFAPSVSADGERLAVTVTNPNDTTWEIRVAEAGSGFRVLADLPGVDANQPSVSPDGEWVAYARAGKNATSAIDVRRFDGSGEVRSYLEATDRAYVFPLEFSPDNRWLLAGRSNGGRTEYVAVELEAGTGDAGATLLPADADAFNASLSPDGRWIAYESRATGTRSMFIRRINDDWTTTTATQVAVDARRPVWVPRSGDGTLELRFETGGYRTAVDVTPSGGRARISSPRRLFEVGPLNVEGMTPLPSGGAVATQKGPEEDPGNEIRYVPDFLELVKRRAPR